MHEIRCLHVVAVGIVIGNRTPVVGEVEIHDAGLHCYFVANDMEQFVDSLPKRVIFPDLVELRKGLKQVDVSVHGLVAERESAQHRIVNDWVIRLGLIRGSIAMQCLKVALIDGIMGVLVDPAKGLLGQRQGCGVMRSLIGGGKTVDGKAHAIEMLSVGEFW